MKKEIKELLEQRIELSENLDHYLSIDSIAKAKIVEKQIEAIDELIKCLSGGMK